jgi:hypothetical protein
MGSRPTVSPVESLTVDLLAVVIKNADFLRGEVATDFGAVEGSFQ